MNHSTVLLVAALILSSSCAGLAQPLRQAVPSIKVLGEHADPQGGPSGTSGKKGQIRTYGSSKNTRSANLGSVKKNDVAKLTAEAARLINDGITAQKKGDLNGALLKFNRSLAIREQFWGERDRSIPVLLERIAEVYAKQKKYASAGDSLDKALSYYTRIYGPGTPERIQALMSMGKVLQEKKDYEKSFDSYKQAYMLIERSKGKESPEASKLRITLARLAEQNGWDQTAVEYYQSIVDLDSTRMDAEEFSKAMEEYSDVLIKLGKEDQAKQILAKVHHHE